MPNLIVAFDISFINDLLTLTLSDLSEILGKTYVKEIAEFLKFYELQKRFALKGDIHIDRFGLSKRTTNALLKHNIYTLNELLSLSYGKLRKIKGIGSTCVEEICDLIECLYGNSGNTLNFTNKSLTYSFSGYWKEIQKNNRHFNIFIDYYNGRPHTTLQDLADKYGVTRELIRQVIVKGTRQFQGAYTRDMISKELIDTLDRCASERTEVRMLNIKDELFSDSGIAYLVSAFKPSPYMVSKSKDINGHWLLKSNDDIEKVVHALVNELRINEAPMAVNDIINLYSIDEKLLMSIKDIVISEGYATHSKNRIASGTDKNRIIKRYLEIIKRPASVFEISEHTSLSFNQIRGALFNKKDEYVNVGKSVYDLSGRDYKELSVVELAVNFLLAENRALKLDFVCKYIQRYKNIDERYIVSEMLNSSLIKQHLNYVLLSNWSLDKLSGVKRVRYSISLRDAVLEIINSSNDIFDYQKVYAELAKYDGRVSMVSSSIKTTLNRIADDGLIERIGGPNSGCYIRKNNGGVAIDSSILESRNLLDAFIDKNLGKLIEIRYKTKRLNSDKRWRVLSVIKHDNNYIYTDDIDNFGHNIHYSKRNIVDYREYKNIECMNSALFKTNSQSMASDGLIVGGIYRNDDLMDIFKVSGQGGMRKSNKTNSLVLISKHKSDNPYDDKWVDGRFEYTGMGLYGDQSIDYLQNKTLAESKTNGVVVYLFESFASNSYIYRGIVELDKEPYYEIQRDELGKARKVIKFSLKVKQ